MTVSRERRSDRVRLMLPIEVMGTDISGHEFMEKTQTLLISRHGATIVLNRKLAPDQEVTIHRVGTDKEANFRVVGQIGGQPDSFIYGVAFVDPKVNLWGIKFPRLTEAEKDVGRILLECSRCQTREVVHLNELAAEVFEANRRLTRPCKQCSASTLWKETFHDLPAEKRPSAEEVAPQPVPAPEPPARTSNERRDFRARLNMTACILQPGFGEEVVITENVSRGGLRFTSGKRYIVGSRVEVVVPYTQGGANIFRAARIVYSQKLEAEELYRYGVVYLRGPQVRAGG